MPATSSNWPRNRATRESSSACRATSIRSSRDLIPIHTLGTIPAMCRENDHWTFLTSCGVISSVSVSFLRRWNSVRSRWEREEYVLHCSCWTDGWPWRMRPTTQVDREYRDRWWWRWSTACDLSVVDAWITVSRFAKHYSNSEDRRERIQAEFPIHRRRYLWWEERNRDVVKICKRQTRTGEHWFMCIFEDLFQLLTFGQFGEAEHRLSGTEFQVWKLWEKSDVRSQGRFTTVRWT